MRLPFLSSTLAAVLAAGLVAGDAPLAQADLPDIARTVRRLEASPLGRAWNDAALAPWRTWVKDAMEQEATAMGVDPLAVLLGAGAAQVRLDRLGATADHAPDVAMHAYLALGATTAAAWKPVGELLAREGAPAQVAGLLAAFAMPSDPIPVTIGHTGQALVALVGGAAMPSALMARRSEDDAVVEVGDYAGVMRGIGAIQRTFIMKEIAQMKAHGHQHVHGFEVELIKMHERSLVGQEQVLRLAPDLFAPFTLTARVQADGIRERWTQRGPGAMAPTPADRALLARLPDATLMAMAIGLDGAAMWKAYGPAMLIMAGGAIPGEGPIDPQQVAAMADGFLAQAGITQTLAQLIGSVRGTALVAVTPAAPFPAVTIAIPRSAGLDQALGVLLQMGGMALPKPGEVLPIPIPDTPLTLTIGGDAGHLVASTDPAIIDRWVAGTKGGLLASAAAKRAAAVAPADAMIVGFSDTPALLRLVPGFLAMAPMPAVEKARAQQAILRLAGDCSTGWMWSGISGGHRVTEMQGLVGGLPLLVLGGAAIGYIGSSRSMGQMQEMPPPLPVVPPLLVIPPPIGP